MAKSGGEGKVSNSLVAASCAAILALYTAGYSRTRDAARKFEIQSEERRSATRSEPVPTTVPTTSREAAHPQPDLERAARSMPSVDPSPVASTGTAPIPQEVETPSPALASAHADTEVAEVPIAAAPEPTSVPQAAPEPVAPPAPKWKDGTYTGWGTSRHGDIEARVVIREGRIVESGISQCLTRYSCDVIDTLIPQPVQLQSANVSYVSRATESSDAYYFALVDALGKASPSQ